jgi:hypothetical protein
VALALLSTTHNATVAEEVGLVKRLLRRLLYGGSRSLRAHEERCFEAFSAALPTEAADILEVQLTAIDLIQRFSNDKLVVLHLNVEEKEVPLLPNQAPELYAGRIWLSTPEATHRITCDLVTHRGRLSSLEFSERPGPLAHREVHCERIQLFQPLLQEQKDAPSPSHRVSYGPILGLLRGQVEITQVEPPVQAEELRRFLGREGSVVPGDYVELLSETDGFSVAGWRVLGTKTRRIVHRDANYQVLAEDPQNALCAREGQEVPGVMLYDQIADEFTELPGSFVDSLLKAVALGGQGSSGALNTE